MNETLTLARDRCVQNGASQKTAGYFGIGTYCWRIVSHAVQLYM